MRQKNLRLFYLHSVFFEFSNALLSIVLPIFIYQLFGSVAAVFAFELAWNAAHSILLFPLLNLSIKWKHPKFFMALGVLFYGASLALMGQASSENLVLFYWGLLFFCLHISFYWIMRHWFFILNVDTQKVGEQTSLMMVIETVVSFLGPILGGWLALTISFSSVFILGSITLLLATLPVFLFRFPVTIETYSWARIKSAFQQKDLKNLAPVYFCEGVGLVTISTAWILAFTLFIGSIWQFGLLTGITTGLTALIAWMTGRFFDQKKRTDLLSGLTKARVGTVLLYLSVMLFHAPVYVWLVEFLNRLLANSHKTVTDAYTYAFGSRAHALDFTLVQEMYLNMSRGLFAALFMMMFLFLEEWFLWVVLAVGGLSVLGFLGLKKADYLLEGSHSKS